MQIKKLFPLAGLLVCLGVSLLSGCATSQGTRGMLGDNPQPLALLVLVPERQVEFFEKRAAVIAGGSVANLYTYDGIWDPCGVIEQIVTDSVESSLGIEVRLLRDTIGKQAYGEIAAECEQRFNKARRRKRGSLFMGPGLTWECADTPPSSYLDAAPLKQLTAACEKTPVDLVLEISLAGISYNVADAGIARRNDLWVCLYGRVLRLSDGKIVGQTRRAHRVSLGRRVENFTAVERDNLRLLKEDFRTAMNDALEADGKFLRRLFK